MKTCELCSEDIDKEKNRLLNKWTYTFDNGETVESTICFSCWHNATCDLDLVRSIQQKRLESEE